MLKVIRELLLKIVDNIDSGNSNISEDEAIQTIKCLRNFTDKEQILSKYQAYQYLNISRASFDNYIRDGLLPRGKKQAGFKELSWTKKSLDQYIKQRKRKL